MRQSRADRANGPNVSSVRESGSVPALETTPRVGLRPVTPFALPGPRIEPPVSEASAAKHRPAAVAAALPLEDVPTQVSGSHGLKGVGKSTPRSARAASDIRSLPTTIAPAAFSALITSASSGN